MRYLIGLYVIKFLVISQLAIACQCPITALTITELNNYDIIFKGKILTVNLNNKNSEALFNIDELYKGTVSQEFKILFNNEDICKLDLRAGDEWIIYTNYYQVDNAKLNFCSRSRKFIKNKKEDFFEVTSGVSYNDEFVFLQTKLGLHKVLKNVNPKIENRNIIPNTKQVIITLLCSILGVILFYWICNRLLFYFGNK